MCDVYMKNNLQNGCCVWECPTEVKMSAQTYKTLSSLAPTSVNIKHVRENMKARHSNVQILYSALYNLKEDCFKAFHKHKKNMGCLA